MKNERGESCIFLEESPIPLLTEDFYSLTNDIVLSFSGSGCSSVGGGAFTEFVPFYPTGDG